MIVKYICTKCGYADYEIEDLSEYPHLRCKKCGSRMKNKELRSLIT